MILGLENYSHTVYGYWHQTGVSVRVFAKQGVFEGTWESSTLEPGQRWSHKVESLDGHTGAWILLVSGGL
jgi:hypothetical protein